MAVFGNRVAMVALATLAAIAGPGLACQPIVDPRPFGERLLAAPLAFIGTVSSADARQTTFLVEHALRGAREGDRVTVDNPPPSTCTVVFVAGTRWLYGGGSAQDATLRLGPATAATPELLGRLSREPEDLPALQAAWQHCTADAQCVPLNPPCGGSAVNARHLPAARAEVARAGVAEAVTPRSGVAGQAPSSVAAQASACPGRAGTLRWPAPLCVASRCGLWGVH